VEGRSFFTTGPLLLLDLDGHRPGDVIYRNSGDKKPLTARVRVRSEVAPVTHIELVVNGQSVAVREIPARQPQTRFELDTQAEANEPLWVAARAWSATPPGRPDAEAHTNPVYVTVNGKLPYRESDLDWLVNRLDEQIGKFQHADFAGRAAVLEFYAASRRALVDIRKSHGQRLSRHE
jgi:hypothetical protein